MSIDSPSDCDKIQYNHTEPPISRPLEDPSHFAAWTDLHCEIPNSLAATKRLEIVEAALVELAHEPVAVQLAFRDEWTLFFDGEYASIDRPEGRRFVRHRVTSTAGRQTRVLSRAAVRDQLATYLSRSTDAERGSFTVRALTII